MSQIKEQNNIEKKTFLSFFRKKESRKEEEFKLGFNRFKKEILKRKLDFFKLFIATLFIFIPVTFGNFLNGKILDSLIKGGQKNILGYSFDLIWWFVGLYIFVQILWRIFDLYVYKYKSPRVANDIYKSYSKEIFKKVISYPISFFKEKSLGRVVHSFTTGVDKTSESVSKTMYFVGYPFMTIFNIMFLFYISWKIALVVFIGSILYWIHLKLTIEKRKRVTREFNNIKKEISSKITESINFSIEIKKNLKEEKEFNSLSNLLSNDFQDKFYNKVNFNLINSLFLKILFLSVSIIVLFMIIFQYKSGFLTEGDVLAIIMYSSAVMRNVNFIVNYINTYIESFTLIGDTEKLLLQTPENYDKDKKSKKVEGEIEFKNLDFEYELENEEKEKKKFSLKNINLKIEKGQKVAFVGESGGGKSTSIELIGGFYFPNKGEILVDNISTREWNLNDLRKSIAYVSQDIAIFNTTIKDNIAYGSLKENISDEEIREAAKLAHIDEYIENLPDKYDTKVGEKGLKLSGGQRQRIAIARAILRNPKILILDEPTSALDIKSETYITEALKDLMKGRTTIIIAHRISTIRDADKIFVFHRGEIVEEGSYRELTEKDGRFKEMVELSDGLN